MNELFFIYGSFRDPDHIRNGLFTFQGAKPLIEEIRTKPEWDLKNVTYGDFPALIPGTDVVLGSIFEVPSDVIQWMDLVEDVKGGLYKRITIDFSNETQFNMTAWAYQFIADADLDDRNIGIEYPTYAKYWKSGGY